MEKEKIKKIIIILIFFVFGGLVAHAEYAQVDNGIRFLRANFQAGTVFIESFEDTKTGIVCYVGSGRAPDSHFVADGVSISCVKK